MKQKGIEFKEASFEDIIGTSSYRGYIKSTAYAISKVLGNHNEGDGNKTSIEWWKKYGSIVFTVYDYKEEVEPKPYHIVEYHIGTKCSEDTSMIVEILKNLGLDAYISK